MEKLVSYPFLKSQYWDFLWINASVIRQKGESENGCYKKTKHVKFSEKRKFLTQWYAHVCVRIRGKKCSFFGKFGVLCFLETPVLRFALLPYYRRKSETLFFFVCSGGGLPKQYWNSDADHLLLPDIKTFYETKIVLELVSLPHFLHDFSRKIFLTLNSHNCTNFTHWLSLLLEILGAGNMCIVIICFPVYGVKILKYWLSSRSVFLHDQKSHDKNLNILKMKRAFAMK